MARMAGLAAQQLGNGRLGGLATGGVGWGRGEESIVVPLHWHVLSFNLPVSCEASRVRKFLSTQGVYGFLRGHNCCSFASVLT